MKKVFFLILFLTLISCKEYKALMSEKTNYNKEVKLNFSDENKESINVNINGIPHNLFFDTGAGVTLINNPKFNIENQKIIRQKTIYGFDKKTKSTSTTYTIDSVKTNLFTTTNKHLYISKKENIINCSAEKYDGILGNFFSEIESEIILNYESGFIEIKNQEVDKTGFYELKSKFSSTSGKFYIELGVNGLNDFFLFDTGNKTGIILNSEVYKNLKNKIITFSTINYAVNNTELRSSYDIYQCNFKISEKLVINQYCALATDSKRSVLNQQFIKKFNWIIDSKNQKVYCKPIDNKQLEAIYKIPKYNQLVGVRNDKIIVAFCLDKISRFNLGDQITSINSKKVTPENICEMQSLLNKTKDWETLNLEVIPVKTK